MASTEFSIVEYYAEHEGYRCGYCKCSDSNYSHGMWAHSLTVEDYQDLIERGWRRSGRYCYKPTMHVTCCPMYTIRCAALDCQLTKSQKKVLKRVHRFLAHGDTRPTESRSSVGSGSQASETDGVTDPETTCSGAPDLHPGALGGAEKVAVGDEPITLHSSLLGTVGLVTGYLDGVISDSLNKISSLAGDALSLDGIITDSLNRISTLAGDAFSLDSNEDTKNSDKKRFHKPGVGPDVSRPPCKKAKLLRLEHKQQKLVGQGLSRQEAESVLCKNKSRVAKEKSIEDFINDPLPDKPAHRLEVRLVASNPDSAELRATFDQEMQLYRKYQMAVHGDPPEKCTQRQYTRFLVNSPLQAVGGGGGAGPPQGYGSFHQQYWLDGRLVAVGVIDVLPRCVSSVYFYYDPDLGHLSLGTYASLQELCLTRSLHRYAPSLQYYFMGFYIHTCPKMKYKASYVPSFLLCPETYSWNPIAGCLEKLDYHKYSRLDDDLDATDTNSDVDIDEVLVLYRQRAMPYRIYKLMKRNVDDPEEVKQYATLVGKKCARRMWLARP